DFGREDWIPTAAARALLRNNRPLLAYLGGKPGGFTGKDHNFRPGEAVEKQLIVINNCRETVSCECEWSLGLPQPVARRTTITIGTGDQARIPLRSDLPGELAPGGYELRSTVRFGNGETQQDSFTINVLAPPPGPASGAKIALFDPKGETGELLKR